MPQQMLAWITPVDPSTGIGGGPAEPPTLPGHALPQPPGGYGPPIAANPIAPGFGGGGGMPPSAGNLPSGGGPPGHVGGGPVKPGLPPIAIPPLPPGVSHPPGTQPPIATQPDFPTHLPAPPHLPPGTVWPPFNPGEGLSGKALVVVFVPGSGAKWVVIDTGAQVPQPPVAGPK